MDISNLLNNAKVNEIKAGIHENVVLEAIDLQQRKKKSGEVIKKNTYVSFAKVRDGKVYERREIAWFNPDPNSSWVVDTFREQITQMMGILECFYSPEDAEQIFDQHVFKDIDSIEEIEPLLKSKKTATELVKNTMISFFSSLKDHIGIDSKPLRVMFVVKDNYIQQPRFIKFTESMEVSKENSELKLSNEHIKAKAKYDAMLEADIEKAKDTEDKSNINSTDVKIDI